MSPNDPIQTSGMSGVGNPEILQIRGDVKFTCLNYLLHAFGVQEFCHCGAVR
jgi:hypothetical protein